jgi:hypothetical protein
MLRESRRRFPSISEDIVACYLLEKEWGHNFESIFDMMVCAETEINAFTSMFCKE